MNLEQIAKLSDVSRSTVSCGIDSEPNVGDATREEARQIVRQFDYQPNAAARGPATGHTHVLALIVPMGVSDLFTDPYFPSLIQGISSACSAHEYSVMWWLAEPDYERRPIMHSGLIDGVIVVSTLTSEALVQALSEGDLPLVLIGRQPTNLHTSYVEVDNVSGTREAVRHLLRLGRKRIATITGPQDTLAGVDRLAGYIAALRERGSEPDQSLIVAGGFTEPGGYVAMQQLLPRQPDAVFAASDMMAIGALRAIQEAGLRVPEDIAVIGFDDLPLAAHTNPPLTTLRQPIHRSSVMAVEMLIELIEQPGGAPQQIVLPTELVVRTSCGSMMKHASNAE